MITSDNDPKLAGFVTLKQLMVDLATQLCAMVKGPANSSLSQSGAKQIIRPGILVWLLPIHLVKPLPVKTQIGDGSLWLLANLLCIDQQAIVINRRFPIAANGMRVADYDETRLPHIANRIH